MATIVNTPPATENSDNSGMGFFLGVVVLILFVFVLLYYGLPALSRFGSGNPQINVPDKVNVNVQQQPSASK
jgi:hypothetical protein